MNSQRGFTLIEIMITVAVVSILAAVAFPSYTEYVRRSHRSEARNALQSLAQRMEQNYTITGAYNRDAAGAAIVPATFVSAAGLSSIPSGGSARYNLTISTLNAASYTLSATPTGGQTGDTCGILMLDNRSIRGAKGTLDNRAQDTIDCWSR